MTLGIYLAQRYLTAFGGVTLGISILYFLVEIESHVSSYRNHGFSALELVGLTILKTPQSIYSILPAIAGLAALWMSLRLSSTSQMPVIRASGKSGLSTLLVPAAAAFMIGVFATTAVNPLIAIMAEKHGKLISRETLPDRQIYIEEGDLAWLRQVINDRQTVVRASRTVGGNLFEDVHIFVFDQDGMPIRRMHAASAELVDDVSRKTEIIPYSALLEPIPSGKSGFCLYGVRTWNHAENLDELVTDPSVINVDCLPTVLTSTQIREALGPPGSLPFWNLRSRIGWLDEAGFSSLRHRVHFHVETAKPVLLAAMVLLGGCLTLRPARLANMTAMVTVALVLILGAIVLGDFARVLGEGQEVPAQIAAWFPPLVVLVLSLGLLLYLEDG